MRSASAHTNHSVHKQSQRLPNRHQPAQQGSDSLYRHLVQVGNETGSGPDSSILRQDRVQQFSPQTAFITPLFPISAAYLGVLGVVLHAPHEPPLAMYLCGVCPCRDQIWGRSGPNLPWACPSYPTGRTGRTRLFERQDNLQSGDTLRPSAWC